ncbi:arylamine N-acetyltransferase [Bordetella sp. FB-8]|uniref:arylamine N-acetyltransferase family protein n=1 Tax=Bordetella sp. FB-8 TaxID=1159870 RepID=UPI000374F93F|nr:arylamine N-acetyltransferase [Bordetella sp. FB-8]
MTTAFDLDAYFERIRWCGNALPSLETLDGLMRAHMRHIPFENLDVLLGRPVRLDLDSLQQKLVRSRRGGYCFEHMTLFAAAIEALGFQPARHSARVLLMSPRQKSPRTHMFLTVAVEEGTYVLDPGFGGPAPMFPVPLVDCGSSGPADTTHWMYRKDNDWILRHRLGSEPADAWVSTLEHDLPVDFDMANHFTATHPSSPFVNNLFLSLFKPDGRVSVMNRYVAVRQGDQTQSFQLADRAALRALLAEQFGLDLPEVDGLNVPMVSEWNGTQA